jgi:hypothetical protein
MLEKEKENGKGFGVGQTSDGFRTRPQALLSLFLHFAE